jgi:hypothetical protein
MNIQEQLNQIKYLLDYKRGQLVNEMEFSNLPGVQPDKMDYRRPIPDPNILPDCFSTLLKSDINMVSFDTNSLKDESSKRVNNVDMIFDPNSPSDKLGITIIKDGKPFCFVKK